MCPPVGDWDANGTTGVGLYDPLAATFYLTNNLQTGYAESSPIFGTPGPNYEPIVGYWSPNGKAAAPSVQPAAADAQQAAGPSGRPDRPGRRRPRAGVFLKLD